MYHPTKIQTKTIIIKSDSPNLTRHSESDVTFSLPETIEIKSNSHCLIAVTQATIPCTFWMVDYRSDKLVLSGTTFTLGQGNYDADEMTAHLNTLLTGYTVTYSNIRNMITISHSNSFTIDASSTCLHLLGFTSAQVGASATNHEGANQVDFSGVNAVDLLVKGLHTGTINTNFADDDIVARIPIDVIQKEGPILQYNPEMPARLLLPNFSIDELRVVLADESGDHNLVFHGGAWTIVIELQIVHSPRDPKISNMKTEENRIKNILSNKKNGVNRQKNK